MRPQSLSLLALVLLAGCLAGISPTATSGPPDAAWTTGDSLNTTRLATQHFEALRTAGSFTTNHSETIRVNGDAQPDGPRPDGYHPPSFARMQVNLEKDRYRDTFVVVGHRRSSHFITPDVTARHHKPCPDCAFEYAYGHRPAGDTRSKRITRFRTKATVTQLAQTLQGVSVGFNYSYAGTVTRDGEPLHRYRAEQRLETAPPPFGTPPTGRATVLVTDAGVIHRFELQYRGSATVTVDGQPRPVNVTHTFVRTYTEVGDTTIARPAWVNHARNAHSRPSTQTGTTNAD